METLHAFIGTQGQDIGWLQMSLRATLIFVLGVLIVRFAATRAFGKWSALDIILAVIVGSNLSRALTGSAPFLPTLIATVLLVVLHGLLAMAAARWSWLSTLTKGASIPLVRDGQMDEPAMRRQRITSDEIEAAIRQSGGRSVDDAEAVFLETDGSLAVTWAS